MKVKELIASLQKEDQESEVIHFDEVAGRFDFFVPVFLDKVWFDPKTHHVVYNLARFKHNYPQIADKYQQVLLLD